MVIIKKIECYGSKMDFNFSHSYFIVSVFLPLTGQTQCSVGIEYNMAFPITGYDEVFKIGSNFNLEGKYHLNKSWGVGFQAGAARFANSRKDPLEP
jgi:hypothetical protein